ncbi:MAG: PEP-CTERM sorting domain-containing protein [Kiritimatiellae bacterium]|nr:PEP-CTERM sorting domain-containing protein [Kiritimatiellia bacterium]
MKKLIIAAAMVCAAAFAQAATVNWGISNLKAEGGSAPTAGWAVMAFYTEVDAGSSAIVSAIASKTAAALAFDTASLTVSMSKGKVAAKDATVAGITDTSKNYDFYYVVFNNSDATAATKYAIVSDLNKEYSGMASKYTTSGNFSGASWSDVPAPVIPEPTTGLLVLLGVAGLALRRRA